VSNADGPAVDEEIIGDDGPPHKTHLQMGSDDTNPSKLVGRQPKAPPPPIGTSGSPEDEKETAKQRLQRLIRDFAHDAVGPGLEVEAASEAFASSGSASGSTEQKALLRMDHRLSRLELWPPTNEGIQGSIATVAVPLQQVASIIKGLSCEPGDKPDTSDPRNNATVTVIQRNGPDLRLIFDNSISRDRAYTCLRIFQMSVDQSLESQSRDAESDLGYESSVTSP